MKNILITALLIGLFFFNQSSVFSQLIVSPYSRSAKAKMDSLAPTGGGRHFGFLPFTHKEGALQELYNSDKFNSTQTVNFSTIFRDSLSSINTYVEALSYIPEDNLFRLGLAVQLTADELKDTSVAQKDIALQKIINGGGNIVFGFTRPIYYTELFKRRTGFIIWNVNINPFFDVPFVNREVYNPGAGIQLSTNFDLRLITNESKVQSGNLFRFGLRGRGVWNVINKKYQQSENIDDSYKNVAFVTIQPYIGLLFFDFDYAFNISSSNLFNDRREVLKLSIVPVKF